MLHITNPYSSHHAWSDLQTASGFLLDWDGCCAINNRLVPEAADFLRQHQHRSAIVSNNSTNTVEDFLDLLSGEGIEMREDQIVLAGMKALQQAAETCPGPTLVLGDPRMRAVARSLGIDIVQKDADLIVLLRDTRFSYRRLERAVNALRNGGRLIVANPDTTHPAGQGLLMPETGALLAAIRACVDIPTDAVEIIGKPSPHLFRKGCEALGTAYEDTVMIGDNPLTDVKGAGALGIRTCLVDSPPGEFFRRLEKALRTA
ncbi:HAD-IA family hydrolase [Henriciella sp.]|uniref:HAD-IIA family hydrolase n=1 Tax=Henriciella sp. TaxID=1968823 RepID=UPI0026142AC1|nr:HAD-IA family hydrolase [Henriciella sp.]